MLWLLLVGVALVCVHVRMRRASKRARRMLAHLPTYTQLPFIGNMYKFIGVGQDTYRYYEEISKIMEETNQPFALWICNIPGVVIADPEDIRTCAVNCLDKSYLYSFMHDLLGNGLITAPGAIWKRNVKKLGSAFKGSTVDAFLSVFNKQSAKLLKNLENEVNREPFDILEKYLSLSTLEAICETALGESAIDDESTVGMYSTAIIRVQDLIISRAMNIFQHPTVLYRLSAAYREWIQCIKLINHVNETILRKRISSMEKAKSTEKINVDAKVPVKSFLDILLEMRETDSSLTEEQIAAEVNTILLAGQETTAVALNFILLLLGSRQDVQQKVYAEIKSVYGDSKRGVCKEDLSRLVYCEAVILETLRLFPPVPGVLRYADKDVAIKSCVIPEGTVCGLNLWAAGRSQRVWGTRALQYRPERWLEPGALRNDGAALLSFSIGKRTCIGKRYALNFLKCFLVQCVREFEFQSEAREMSLYMSITLRTNGGNLLRVRRREGRTVTE